MNLLPIYKVYFCVFFEFYFPSGYLLNPVKFTTVDIRRCSKILVSDSKPQRQAFLLLLIGVWVQIKSELGFCFRLKDSAQSFKYLWNQEIFKAEKNYRNLIKTFLGQNHLIWTILPVFDLKICPFWEVCGMG